MVGVSRIASHIIFPGGPLEVNMFTEWNFTWREKFPENSTHVCSMVWEHKVYGRRDKLTLEKLLEDSGSYLLETKSSLVDTDRFLMVILIWLRVASFAPMISPSTEVSKVLFYLDFFLLLNNSKYTPPL